MANVSILPAPRLKPSESVIEMLEGLLTEAKSGSLRAIAIAKGLDDECTQVQWAIGPGVHKMLVLGAITQLQHDYAEHVRSCRDDG